MLGAEHSIWIGTVARKITFQQEHGRDPTTSEHEAMRAEEARKVWAAMDRIDRENAEMWRGVARAEAQDRRTLAFVMASIFGIWALCMVGLGWAAS